MLAASGFEIVRERGPLSETRMLELAGAFDAYLCGDDALTRKVIEKSLPRLKVISKYGIGIDKIDLQAATDHSIPVLFTPGVNHTTVAEHTFALMLAAVRKLVIEANHTARGEWTRITGNEICGKTLAIVGFGRIGKDFGTERLGVQADIMTMAKGLTNAAVPMGAVAVHNDIYDAIVNGVENGIELFHGYTYSGHPLAAAAAIASMNIHRNEDLPGRALAIEDYFADGAHSLRGLPNVIDIRNFGMIAGIELAPRPGKPTQRAMDIFRRCFDDGLLIRVTGDIIALSPPLIIEKNHVDRIFNTLGEAIRAEAA